MADGRRTPPCRQVPAAAGVTIRLRRTLRVAPNRVCCNALLAAYARARIPQWAKVRPHRVLYESGKSWIA